MIKLTGLWMNKTADGKSYMSGTLGGAKVMIFANTFKEEDKHPDYQLYIAEPKKKEEGEKKKFYNADDIPF